MSTCHRRIIPCLSNGVLTVTCHSLVYSGGCIAVTVSFVAAIITCLSIGSITTCRCSLSCILRSE